MTRIWCVSLLMGGKSVDAVVPKDDFHSIITVSSGTDYEDEQKKPLKSAGCQRGRHSIH